MSHDWAGKHEEGKKMTNDSEFIEDDPNYVVEEYRCSKCRQIGGDSDNGAYAGCPKNNGGKHDTNGGTV